MEGEVGPGGSAGTADDCGVASALSDGVALVAPDGRLSWVNDAFTLMIGLERDELLGTDGFALLHPDDRARAVDGALYARQFPGQVSAVPYRVRHGDGRYISVELKSTVIERPDGDHLGLVLRDGTHRSLLHRALRSIANGEPFGVTALLVARSIRARWPGTGVAVSVADRRSGREVIAEGLPPELIDHAAGRLAGWGAHRPWEGLGGPGQVGVHEVGDLSVPLATVARQAGFAAVGVAPIADPGPSPGCLILWFDHAAVARLEYSHAATELTELLGLGLERRHHLWQLWHSARHDGLTGLWNRVGFVERLEEEVLETRRDGAVAFLLYVDLDGLKELNDRHGHLAGDQALVAVADRLRRAVPAEGAVGRLGGDEFTVLASAPAAEVDTVSEALADRLVEALRPDGGAPLAASIGLARDDGVAPPQRLLEAADDAMYRAKAAGRGRWSR